MLQDALDREDWAHKGDILAEAEIVTRTQGSRSFLDPESHPFPSWWTFLPKNVSQIPPNWPGFDLADVVVALALPSVSVRD